MRGKEGGGLDCSVNEQGAVVEEVSVPLRGKEGGGPDLILPNGLIVEMKGGFRPLAG